LACRGAHPLAVKARVVVSAVVFPSLRKMKKKTLLLPWGWSDEVVVVREEAKAWCSARVLRVHRAWSKRDGLCLVRKLSVLGGMEEDLSMYQCASAADEGMKQADCVQVSCE